MTDTPRKNEVLPNPDPSAITTAAIKVAIENLEDKIGARLNGIDKATEAFHNDLTRVPTLLDRSILGLRELIETRLNGMDKDITSIHATLDRRQQVISEQVQHTSDLFGEKFLRIQTQINERDVQTDKASRDVKSAVDAAFAAAKEAVGEQNKSNALSITKSETATMKQIDGIFELLKTNTRATDDKIADIKDRLTMIESHSKGGSDLWGYIVGIAGMAAAVIMAGVAIIHLAK